MPAFVRLLLTAWLLAAAALAHAQPAGKNVVVTERVRAELLAHAPQGVAPGQALWVGLQLAHQPEWHTYWKNPGDSGLPTQLQLTLPAGVQAGEVQWPVPKKIPVGTLANYGYEGTVLLPVPLTVTPAFKPSALSDTLDVKLHASWLVCRTECIPEEGDFTLKVPLRSSTAINAAAFDAAFAAQPTPLPQIAGGAIPPSVARIAGDALEIEVQGLPVPVRGQKLAFFPETGEVIEPAGAWTQEWRGAVWRARVPLSSQRSASPQLLPVVLSDGRQGWRTELQVAGTWPAVAAAAAVSPALQEALRSNATAPSTPPSACSPPCSARCWAASC